MEAVAERLLGQKQNVFMTRPPPVPRTLRRRVLLLPNQIVANRPPHRIRQDRDPMRDKQQLPRLVRVADDKETRAPRVGDAERRLVVAEGREALPACTGATTLALLLLANRFGPRP